jgi:hypothetical protein
MRLGLLPLTRSNRLKKQLCCLSISAILQEYIHYFTVPIDGTPKIVLYALNLDENLIEDE